MKLKVFFTLFISLIITTVIYFTFFSMSEEEANNLIDKEITKYLKTINNPVIYTDYYEETINNKTNYNTKSEVLKINTNLMELYKSIDKLSKKVPDNNEKINKFRSLHFDLTIAILDSYKINPRLEENIILNKSFSKIYETINKFDEFSNKYKFNVDINTNNYYFKKKQIQKINERVYKNGSDKEKIINYINDFYEILYITRFDDYLKKTEYGKSDIIIFELVYNQRNNYINKTKSIEEKTGADDVSNLYGEFMGRTSNLHYNLEKMIYDDYNEQFLNDLEFSFERLQGLAELYDLKYGIVEQKIVKK